MANNSGWKDIDLSTNQTPADTGQTANIPVLKEAPAENWDETIRRKAGALLDPRSGSLTSAIGNFISDPLVDALVRKKAVREGQDPEQALDQAHKQLIERTRKYRQDNADFSERQDALAGRGVVTSFLQDVASDLLGDPAQFLLPGGHLALGLHWSVVGQGRRNQDDIMVDGIDHP